MDYKVALYIRLSREDEDKTNESESIINQKSLLLQYTKENNQTFKNYLDNQCNFKKYFPEGGKTNV